MTSSPRALTSSSVNLSYEQQPEVSTESEQAELPVLHTEPVDTSSYLSMKVSHKGSNLTEFLRRSSRTKARSRIELRFKLKLNFQLTYPGPFHLHCIQQLQQLLKIHR